MVVRPMKGVFEIVAGCRRFKALKALGWKKIPCVVADLNDEEAYLASLTENLQRDTLGPIEEAKAFKRYVDEFGRGSETLLAEKISKSQEYVSQRISLLKLPSDVIELLTDSRLKPSVARELVSASDPRVQSFVARTAARDGLTVSAVRTLVAQSDIEFADPYQRSRRSATEEAIEKWKRQERIVKKAILALRVALIKLDSLIEDTEPKDDDAAYGLLLGKRQELHKIVDDVIRWKVAKTKESAKLKAVYG